MYAILVLKHGLDPEYVLDRMEMYEIRALMKYEYFTKKDEWEQSRLIAWIIAQVNSKNRLKMEDVTKFYWETEEEEKDTSMSREDLVRLREKAEEYKKYLKKK